MKFLGAVREQQFPKYVSRTPASFLGKRGFDGSPCDGRKASCALYSDWEHTPLPAKHPPSIQQVLNEQVLLAGCCAVW